MYRENQEERLQLKTNRSLLKLIFLGLITLGIYPLVVYTKMSCEINVIASPYDRKKTMNYCLMVFVIAPLTLSIGAFVWCHRLSKRIGVELARRGLPYHFGAGTFWGCNLLSVLLMLALPVICLYLIYAATVLLPQLGIYWLMAALALVVVIAIGPMIYLHKLCTAMNMLCADYNVRG